MYPLSRVIRCVALVFLSTAMLLTGQIRSAGAVEAASLGVDLDFDYVGCVGIEGTFSWTDVPDDGWVFLLAQDDFAIEQDFYYIVDSFHNEGGIADTGSAAFEWEFESSDYEWTLFLEVHDTAWNPLLEVSDTISRPCVSGSVSPGGTGDGSVDAIDSRSGDGADPVEPGDSADDPDDDGRVQVP